MKLCSQRAQRAQARQSPMVRAHTYVTPPTAYSCIANSIEASCVTVRHADRTRCGCALCLWVRSAQAPHGPVPDLRWERAWFAYSTQQLYCVTPTRRAPRDPA